MLGSQRLQPETRTRQTPWNGKVIRDERFSHLDEGTAWARLLVDRRESYNCWAMSLLTAVLSFAAVAGVLTVIPGLDTAVVLRSAARHGRSHGFATALGVNTGALAWGAAAAVGISALLTASASAYAAMRFLGAIYMVWLGVRLLVHALRRTDADHAGGNDPQEAPSLLSSWSRGALTNLLNPKIGAFYVAVLPQFIPAHDSHLAVGLLLAGVHDVEAAVWFTAIILATQTIRSLLRRRSARRTIDGATGAALIGFGIDLAASAN